MPRVNCNDRAFVSNPPRGRRITAYDRQHLATYLSLLYAEGEGTSIEDMAREILGLDPDVEPDRTRVIVKSHLARARWLATSGYKLLLENEADNASDRSSST